MDEYQDTNVVQYLWLRLLAQGAPQHLLRRRRRPVDLSWRGAEVENILRFEKDFPGARIVRLERNYRSTAPILAAASALIAHNEGRLGKTLRPGRHGRRGREGRAWSACGTPTRRPAWSATGSRRCAATASALAEMAILVRAGFQTRAFEERLITLGLPYRVVGGLRFYERAEIRDAIAYLRVLAQPADDLAFERIVNVPRRGVGEAALRALHEAARANAIPLTAAAARLVADRRAEGQGARGARRAAARLRPLARDAGRATATWSTVATLLDESGYTAMWQQDKSPDAPGRLENLKELVRALADFETLAGFLDHVALVMENDEKAEADRVSLMTLHGAKGLEFDTVFLPGWEEGVFPNQRSLDEGGLQGAGGGAAAGLCRPDPGAPARHRQPRRQPAHLRQLAEQHPQPLPRRTARGRGGRAAARPRWRAMPALAAPPSVRRAVPAAGAPAAR